MLNPEAIFDDEHDPVAPECRATVDALQLVLDGETGDALDADPHATACPTCRERVRTARVMFAVLAAPSNPVPAPAGFADKVMVAVWDERHARRYERLRRGAQIAAVFAIAASLLVVAFVVVPPSPKNNTFVNSVPVAPAPEVVPAPREKPPAPAPPPIRISDAVAQAGQAFRDTPKPLADSVAVAPKLYDAFTTAFRPPADAVAPMGEQLEPARKSLAELPDAARSGLEPVTGTAQKAFDRLLRDVACVKPKS